MRPCFCVMANNVISLNFQFEQNTYKRSRKWQYSQVRKCMFSGTSDAHFWFVNANFSCSLINKVKHIYAVLQDTQSFEWVYSSRVLARHVSDLTGPSSGAFLQAVLADLVCGNTRTTWHVQPLQLRNGWTCQVVRTVVPHPKSAHTACTKCSWWWTGEIRNMSS